MSKVNLTEVKSLLGELEVDDRANSAWRQCYFDGDDNPTHSHDDGTCIRCDWRKQAAKATDWYDESFFEAWEYKEHWEKNVKIKAAS